MAKPTDNTKNASLERELLLVKLIHQRFDEQPEKVAVSFTFKELSTYSLLQEYDALKITLEKIKADPTLKFEYEFLKHGVITSADDYGPPSTWPQIIYAVKIILEDKTGLVRRLNELRSKIEKETNHQKFILNEEGKLFLEGSNLSPYTMKKGRGRHELVYYLAKLKKPVTTEKLAERFSKEKDDIRRMIERIKTEVSRKLEVSRTALIKNDDNGYSIPTVTLNISTGHTP